MFTLQWEDKHATIYHLVELSHEEFVSKFNHLGDIRGIPVYFCRKANHIFYWPEPEDE